MLSRMWTAESEKLVTAALIDEYAAAATTAKGTERAPPWTLTLTVTLLPLTLNPVPVPDPDPDPNPTLTLTLPYHPRALPPTLPPIALNLLPLNP